MKDRIRKDYSKWLTGMTNSWCSEHGEFTRLMEYLQSREFKSPVFNDSNRASDGIEYRMRFIDNTDLGYTYRDVYLYLNMPCTMLEMMAALASRCEEQIMWDPDSGDKTGLWFYMMIANMGLEGMTDDMFDEDTVYEAVNRVIFRTYPPSGEGGLFVVHDPDKDMRYAEIWYQLNWYLDELNS